MLCLLTHPSPRCADSDATFTDPTYAIKTTSQIEYWFVVDPPRGLTLLRRDAYPPETIFPAEQVKLPSPSLTVHHLILSPALIFPAEQTLNGAARPRRMLPLAAFDEALCGINERLSRLHDPPYPVATTELVAGRECHVALRHMWQTNPCLVLQRPLLLCSDRCCSAAC